MNTTKITGTHASFRGASALSWTNMRPLHWVPVLLAMLIAPVACEDDTLYKTGKPTAPRDSSATDAQASDAGASEIGPNDATGG